MEREKSKEETPEYGFAGVFEASVGKNRHVTLPKPFRPYFENEKYMSVSFGEFGVYVLPETDWEEVGKKYVDAAADHPDEQKRARFYYPASSDVKLNKDGTITIPKNVSRRMSAEPGERVVFKGDEIGFWVMSQEAWDQKKLKEERKRGQEILNQIDNITE